MNPGLRAGLVIAAVAIASAIAGAAVDRAFLARSAPPREFRGFGRPSPDQDAKRRTAMLDRLTKELSLSAAQRAGLDSVFQRTDSSLRAIRRQTQPRIQQVFERSRADIDARLDSTQRAKFAQMHNKVPDEFRGGRGRGRGGRGPGFGGDSGRQ